MKTSTAQEVRSRICWLTGITVAVATRRVGSVLHAGSAAAHGQPRCFGSKRFGVGSKEFTGLNGKDELAELCSFVGITRSSVLTRQFCSLMSSPLRGEGWHQPRVRCERWSRSSEDRIGARPWFPRTDGAGQQPQPARCARPAGSRLARRAHRRGWSCWHTERRPARVGSKARRRACGLRGGARPGGVDVVPAGKEGRGAFRSLSPSSCRQSAPRCCGHGWLDPWAFGLPMRARRVSS